MIAALGSLALLHLLMAMLPGPNTLLVMHLAASGSRRAGLAAAAGVALGSAIWVIVALLGLAVLMARAGELYRLLQLAGALYLIYVGFRMVLAGLRRPAGEGGPSLRASGRAPLLRGLATTLANPKSAVFWSSVFLVALPAQAPAWFAPAIVAVVTVQAFAWYGFCAVAGSTGPARAAYARFGRRLDLLAGGVMLLLGGRLGWELVRQR